MTGIRVEDLSKRFGAVAALDAVSLGFPAGSFTALLGPSGCGKTTLLRLIAGFEAPDGGRVLMDGSLVADSTRQTAPEERGIGFVFQSYALWPHLDVAGNVAYPLQARRVRRAEIGPRVEKALRTVGLDGFEGRRIDELSGGQRQRVALARCLIAEARVILFDEPLANLDIHLRASMVDVFRRIHRETKATVVYVTHDQAEALALAGRIAVMEQGRVLQVAAPSEIYRAPATVDVARFVGRGSILDGTVTSSDGQTASVTVGGAAFTARMKYGRTGPARILLRPEELTLDPEGLAAAGLEAEVLEAEVLDVIYRGPVHEARLRLAGSRGELVADSLQPLEPGRIVRVAVRDAWVVPES